MLELESHRALGAHVAAVFAEGVAHIGHGAHTVVGHGVHKDGRAPDAVAFVADFFVVHAFEVAGGLVDVALDGVGRHVGRLGLVNGQTQARVGQGVPTARARGDHDLAHTPGPDALTLFVLTPFAVLNICPFAVASHWKVLVC